MSTIAYGLKADYDGTVEVDGETVPRFTGGLIRAGERDLDVRAELDAGGGIIVVEESDYAAVLALDAYDALKRVAAHGADSTVGKYDGLTVPELRDELRLRDVVTGGVRDELLGRLAEHDAALEAGPDAVTEFLGRNSAAATQRTEA